MSGPGYAASTVSAKKRERGRAHMLEIRSRPEVQEKIRVHLEARNPFRDPEVRRKSILTQAAKGWSNLNGGNGTPLPVPVRLLSQRLRWPTEVVVPVNPWSRKLGIPKNYRID